MPLRFLIDFYFLITLGSSRFPLLVYACVWPLLYNLPHCNIRSVRCKCFIYTRRELKVYKLVIFFYIYFSISFSVDYWRFWLCLRLRYVFVEFGHSCNWVIIRIPKQSSHLGSDGIPVSRAVENRGGGYISFISSTSGSQISETVCGLRASKFVWKVSLFWSWRVT